MVCCVAWSYYRGQGDAVTPLVDSSEFDHCSVHGVCIDGGVIPPHAVACLTHEPSDHAVCHAAHELIPGGLIVAHVCHTRLSGVVEKLIVADPKEGIPGFVVCPTVVGVVHGVVCCLILL